MQPKVERTVAGRRSEERRTIEPGIKRIVLPGGGERFEAYGRRDGRKRYVGRFRSLAEAREAIEEDRVTGRRIERGELPPDIDARRTVGDTAAAWLSSLRKRRARSESNYAKRVELYIQPELGSVSLVGLQRRHVVALRDRLADRYAPATVNGILTCLSSLCTYAVDRGWLSANPCHRVKPVEDPETAYNWIRTREEARRLLLVCDGPLRVLVAIALLTGMRLDEILHLQWVDVDLARRLITVHRGRKGTVKSGRVRYVPILDGLLSVLREWRLQANGAVLVLPGRGGEVRSKQGVTKIYKLALRRAQLDESLRFHDLRHTFASHWMLNRGCIFKLSRILGHSNVKVTMRYAHLAPDAFEEDYGRIMLSVPTEPAQIYDLRRDSAGRIVGRDAVGARGRPGRC